MPMTNEQLRMTPYFHLADPTKLVGLQEHAEWLEAILHNPCGIWDENGESILLETKQLVARVQGLKIEVYPNEHPPPHFHVTSPNLDASFTIQDCALLNGRASPADIRKVKHWYKSAKPLLVDFWNETRPTNCIVGCYSDRQPC